MPEPLRLDGTAILVRDEGAGVSTTSGPRPFLHPVRTRQGVTVTDAHPADHDWHLGVSVAVQHAGGVNFWGGPTYVRDAGYQWLDDHGRIVTTSLTETDSGFAATTDWQGPDGTVLLTEQTTWHTTAASDPRAWTFRTTTTLRATTAIELGSPGSHGREGGGYGGFTWRFAPASDVDVRTPDAAGEDAVHGTVAERIVFSARFPEGVATVALAPDDARTAEDPWFVRVSDYPGVGSSLAWDEPVRLDAGAELTRSFRGLVADGRLTDAEAAALLA